MGALATPRSDLAAVALGGRVFVAGGHGAGGTESAVTELAPATARTTSTTNAYARAGANMISGAARSARSLVYVPNSLSGTVDVIDPRTYKVVENFRVGALPQHVVPSYDLRTLYVTNDEGNSLTAIDPRTGKPGRTIPVADPYNMYFTPGGRYAIVVAERNRRLDFRNAHTFKLHHSLVVPCARHRPHGLLARRSLPVASCEFSGQLVKVDVAHERVVGTLELPDGSAACPRTSALSGRPTFYVADMMANGVWKVAGDRFAVTGFIRTGKGTHGLYPSRDGRFLYVSNRGEGSVSVLSFATQQVVTKWRLPGGGSPDMGGVSADGKVLWLSGRYNSEVYAIDRATAACSRASPSARGRTVSVSGPTRPLLARAHRNMR